MPNFEHFHFGLWSGAPKSRCIVVSVPEGVRRKSELFAIFAEALSFPEYFGHNWDAFEECLRDLSWLDAASIVLIAHDGLPLSRHKHSLTTYLEILRDAVRVNPQLHVVFRDEDRGRVHELLKASLGPPGSEEA